MVELLSPGGDFEKIKTAFYFGADAVYCGGPSMHLRAKPTAIGMEELSQAVDYAHALGKKLYVTVNAYARNGDFEALPEYIRELGRIGADAIIVADIGVLATAKEAVPELPVHVSTQASCLNYVAANTYHQLGASRIILGRELSIPEIRELRDKTPPELELEAFVHGAMCMAYSGRCLISAFLSSRDSNRGDCAQPCRWRYKLVESEKSNEEYPIYETNDGTTILSSRDLNTIRFVEEIKASGISSFKIEGRMKSPYYVATVTGAYRRALDGFSDIELLEREICSASHRDFSSGFYFGELKNAPATGDGYVQDCMFIAIVKERSKNGRVRLEQRNRFWAGETLEVLSPGSIGLSFKIESIQNDEGEEIDYAPHPQQSLTINCPFDLREGDILRRRDNN